jgi:hypothetical protein
MYPPGGEAEVSSAVDALDAQQEDPRRGLRF